jgi:CTD nuclear envelope phosphatase 1
MNSLNILSSRVIGPSTFSRPRSKSQGEILGSNKNEERLRGSSSEQDLSQIERTTEPLKFDLVKQEDEIEETYVANEGQDEKSALLDKSHTPTASVYQSCLRSLVKRIADALTALLTTIRAPVVYVTQCFQDENGNYSPMIPLKRIRRSLAQRKARGLTVSRVGLGKAASGDSWEAENLSTKRIPQDAKLRRSYSKESLKSTTSESETDKKKKKPKRSIMERRQLKGKPDAVADASSPPRRSIRIKHNEDASDRRKDRMEVISADQSHTTLTVDNIKSPISTSQSHKATRYPHAPQPPRPLIPRRQPSYSNLVPRSPSSRAMPIHQQQKTLVIDLDETLIHSLAKGGRMSSGHMVEVKLNAPVLAPVSSIANHPTPVIGPQHPILYYVHKRPHCDEFLRKVCKWYKLVVFTASVQEYADPVIDWLEQERKFFVGRYYRQHCTLRNGAYIKDLSSVEPDLSRVCILDNSPMSYIFHEGKKLIGKGVEASADLNFADNAIPIEGWINDPTDNDLLHLIPLLEALQYVTDVRALLALRRGEADV